MKLERWHAWIAAIVLGGAVAIGATKSCGDSHLAIDGGAKAEPPVPAPADLLCDLYVASPNTSWAKLQRGVGGAVGILPANLPGVVIALTDLDPQLAVELDGTAPMYGAVAADPADPSFVVAMKLVDPRRTKILLMSGDAGRYTAKEDAGPPGMTVLVPNRPYGSAAPKLEIAITPNGYLLIGKSEADLARLGPYVTRTLTARPLPGDAAAVVEIPRAALQSTLRPKIESYWKDGKSFLLTQDERMRKERGRPPDFGDPIAIIGVIDKMLGKRMAIVSDLEKIRLVVDITDDATTLTASLTPDATKPDSAAKKWVESMKTGDAAPLLGMPSTSAVALSMRDGEAERADQDAELENAIASALGPRLKEPEKLHAVVESITKARDESFALSFGLDDPPGLLLRAPVRDADAAVKAIDGVFALAKSDPFKEILGLSDVTTKSEELPGLGKITVSTLVRAAKKDAPRRPDEKRPSSAAQQQQTAKPTSLGLAYVVSQGTLLAGGGSEPTVTLKVGAQPDHKLGEEPAMKRFTAALGNDASTLLIAQPFRLDPKRSNLPVSPVGVAIGRKGSDAFVRIDIADLLLREAARWQMGF